MDELMKIMKPHMIDDYNAVGAKTGISLEDYIAMRRYELSANEMKFPGFCKHYVKKIKKMQRLSFFGIIVGVILFFK